jgi:hypothetical protein
MVFRKQSSDAQRYPLDQMSYQHFLQYGNYGNTRTNTCSTNPLDLPGGVVEELVVGAKVVDELGVGATVVDVVVGMGVVVVVGAGVLLEVEKGVVVVGPGVQSLTNGAVVHAHAGHVVHTHGVVVLVLGSDVVVGCALVLLVVGGDGIVVATGAVLDVNTPPEHSLKHFEQLCVSLSPAQTHILI